MQENASRPTIDVDADVIASDGTDLGKVGYVVVSPPEFQITDIVVTTGWLLGRDIVVPIDQVAGVEDGKVRLTVDKSGLEHLKDYVEAHYDRPTDDWMASSGMYPPGGATLWPAGSYVPVPSSVDINAPTGTVGLSEGMEVEALDGHKIGTIDRVQIDGESEKITALVVKQGRFFHRDTVIPVSEVHDTDDQRVVLRLSKDEVEARFGRA